MPGAKGANDEGVDITAFSGGEAVVFQRLVFVAFGLCSFVEGVRTVVKGTRYVNDQDTVIFFNDNVGTEWEARISDCVISGDGAKSDCVSYSCY